MVTYIFFLCMCTVCSKKTYRTLPIKEVQYASKVRASCVYLFSFIAKISYGLSVVALKWCVLAVCIMPRNKNLLSRRAVPLGGGYLNTHGRRELSLFSRFRTY